MAETNIWRRYIKRTFHYTAIAVLVLFSVPTLVYAEDVTPPVTDPVVTETSTPPPPTEPEPTTTPLPVEPPAATPPPPAAPVPPAPSGPGPNYPTGPDAKSYVYNPATGLYESERFTWNPGTKETKPKAPIEYTYNPLTGQWEGTAWKYNPVTNTYVPYTVSISLPPPGAVIIDNPTTTADDAVAAPAASATALADQSSTGDNNSTANGSSNTTSTSNSNGILGLFTDAAITNNLLSTALSGDALVALNTLAGGALSGSASVVANVINLLQSSWNLAADSFTSFVSNLFGNVVGDLFLDPGDLGSSSVATNTDLTVNSATNSSITNNLVLDAVSGDAAVAQNTNAGDATTGDATAVANLVNAINSSIAANQSFLGVLNIFGNLDGDILLPPELIDTLMAASAVGNLDTSHINNTNVLADFENNQTITNNIDAGATSGSATVANNTAAGNATTGDAGTNLTVLNMTGRQVIGKNALLVFVNVLGTWVGVIVDAPTGSTTAALGGDITQNTDLTLNQTSNQAITNNISANATSGDASVTQNTSAGNATSGEAHTAVNLLNINNSQFSLTDWFGVLFINVFGTWNGSFGIDTEAGTVPIPPIFQQPQVAQTLTIPVAEVRAFQFAPQDNGSYSLEETDDGAAALASAQVLSDTSPAPAAKQAQHEKDNQTAKRSDWLFSIIGVVIAASLLGTERVLTTRAKKNI